MMLEQSDELNWINQFGKPTGHRASLSTTAFNLWTEAQERNLIVPKRS